MVQTKPQRLLSLDVLRGITIAGMITVNNPGSWSYVYAPLQHAAWNGLTPTDLVFPFFMFIMGVSMYISYKKFDFQFSKQTFLKLLRRSLLLFLIGLGLNYFGLFCRTLSALRAEDFSFGEKLLTAGVYKLSELRILGVLQRLALVSFFGSLILLTVKQKFVPWLAAIILLVYGIVMIATHSLELTANNIVAVIDRAVLGEAHMYRMGDIRFDPEGLFSTIPCIAHVLIGVMAGRMIDTNLLVEKIERLFILGTVLLFGGFLLSYGLPINKSLWSSSYVLVTCGLAAQLFALLIWIIDLKGHRRWSLFFESFGVNPMAIFVLGGMISVLMTSIGFTLGDTYYTIKGYIYSELLVPFAGNYLGSLLFALLFIALCWSIAHTMYKKKIYIKI